MKSIRELGIGFADTINAANGSIGKFRKQPKRGSKEISNLILFDHGQPVSEKRISAWRLAPLKILIALCCVVIIGRLFSMQIVQGADMRDQSNANRLLVKTIHAPRGILYDRNHTPLVQNIPAFVRVGTNSATPVSYEEALSLEATGAAQNNLEIQAQRQYPFGSLLAHVVGYTSEISQDELDNGDGKTYRLGDRVGRAGLEQQYEDVLRGEDGATYYEVDAKRNTTREIGQEDPMQGNDLTLAIDANLQKVATNELASALTKLHLPAGVVVISKPKTGEILALVSLPSYDDNMFSKPIDPQVYASMINDPNRPFFNRAIGGVYPPGSIFKIVTSAAGLLTHKIDANTQIEDTGVLKLGDYSFANWMWLSSHRTEGWINLTRAIARSNDIFFYKLGEMVGVDQLSKVAKAFGLGKRTGIDLPGEAEGLIPDAQWKKTVKNEIWYPGDTYHMAIGQGDNLVTPVQLNMITNYVANNGYADKPQIVTTMTDANGNTKNMLSSKPLLQNLLPQSDLGLIREGMHQACNTGGTGWPFFNFAVPETITPPGATQSAQISQRVDVGCKTGTAEEGGSEDFSHAWFTVFAPYDNPQISVTVLIESGGEGSDVSAPVAKNILTYYFSSGSEKK